MMSFKKNVVLGVCILFFPLAYGVPEEAPFAPENTEQMGGIDYKNRSDKVWKEKLSPNLYATCRQGKTEKSYSGIYNKFDKKGIYYCACCGGTFPVFRSDTKFESNTGWPSFWAPMHVKNIELHPVESGFFISLFSAPKVEVVCGRCGSHLGHVFNDGPKEHDGKRYCINSEALIFVPDELNSNPPFRPINK